MNPLHQHHNLGTAGDNNNYRQYYVKENQRGSMDNLVPHSTKQTDVTTQHSMLNPSDRQEMLNYGSRGSA